MKLTSNGLTRKQKLRIQSVAITDYGPQSLELNRMNDSIETLRTIIDDLAEQVKAGTASTDQVNNLYKLCNALSGLARARTEVEKVQLETHTLAYICTQQIYENLKDELITRPDLLTELRPLIDQAAAKADNRYEPALPGVDDGQSKDESEAEKQNSFFEDVTGEGK